MAIIQEAVIQQSTGEIRGWTVNYSDDLPTGSTITAGTAVHTPPSGDAAIPTMSFTDDTVTATLEGLSVTGIHYLDVAADFSNGETSEVRIAFTVGYTPVTAREGMLSLIRKLRAMTSAGPADYMVAGEPYWSDAQLQDVLDSNRTEVVFEELTSVPEYSGGEMVYKRYYSHHGRFESGTLVFYVQTGVGNVVGTALYTPDYDAGKITFASDTGGDSYYLTGYSYDLNSAAGDVWNMKAAHYAEAYDMKTDSQDLSRSQLIKQCLQMAGMYQSKAELAVGAALLDRSDTNAFNY